MVFQESESSGEGFIAQAMPEVLTQPGPLGLDLWQWLGLAVVAAGALLAARIFAGLAGAIVSRLARKTATKIDDILAERMVLPLWLFASVGFFTAVLPALDLPDGPAGYVSEGLRALFLAGIFLTLARLADAGLRVLERSKWMEERGAARQLLPLAGRIIRFGIYAVGAITVLQEFGFQVTGLLAGVGLAGMAIALAGQKTLENLLGSATILSDRPFVVGDFVRVDGMSGTVEEVGFRSTRIRTLDRTRITIPNGRLADQNLESLTARDRIRLHCIIGLTYSTKADQMRRIMTEIEEALAAHPRSCETPIRVRFIEFAASSLGIEVFSYVDTQDWTEFLGIRQDLYLQFMDIVERNGCSFAFPTQTVHLETAAAPAAEPGGRPGA